MVPISDARCLVVLLSGGADPVFLGAESMSKLEHALIGSVSEKVLRRANRTVLLVGGHPEVSDEQPQNL